MISEQYTRASVALVVVLALLTATAPMTAATDAEELAQAADGLVVGSSHSTNSEFNNGQLVELSASGGNIGLSVSNLDGHEDGDLDEYVGATSQASITSTNPIDGDYSARVNGSDQNFIYSDTGSVNAPEAGDSFTYLLRPESDSGQYRLFYGAQSTSTGLVNGYNVNFAPSFSGDNLYLEARTSGGVDTLDSTSVDVAALTNESLYANVTWGSSGSHDVTVSYTNGTQIATLTGSDSTYSSGRMGFGTIAFDGSANGVFDGLRDQPQYVSANHSVSGAEQAEINLTSLGYTQATLTVEYWTGSSWKTGNQTTVSSAGVHQLSLPDVSSSTWRVATTVDFQSGGTPEFVLADEGILFTNHAPQADNLSPPDGTGLTQDSVDFSVDVSDPEFSTAQGDSVTASLVLDDETVYSDTVSSNTTVETTEMVTDGGDHEYYWELNDSYGSTTTTETQTLTVPNTLYLYSETVNSTTGQHELLNDTNTSVDVTITGSAGSVKSVNVSDGMVDMTGLPSDESYVFTVDPDGYYPREIYIESIYDQAAVFLLDQNKTAIENSLTVTDRTNQFPDPIITVERVINTSRVSNMPDNGEQWVTIGGDRLGASGFYVVNLQQSSRYRFVVINQAGDERVLGEYTAKVEGEVPLEIGSINYDLGPSNNLYQWTTAATNESGNPAVSFAYADDANLTEWVNVTFRYRNNSEIIATSNFTNDPYGELQYTEPVNATEYDSREFVVEWEASRNGSIISGERVVGGKRTVEPPLSGVWMEIAYGTGVFVLAFLVGAGVGAPAAAVTVSVFAGLSVFIGLAPPALGFGATVLGLFLSVTMIVYGGTG